MPSASAVEGNVRYNETSDKLEIYYEGEWISVLSCGLQTINLIGTDYTYQEVSTANPTYSLTFSNGINLQYNRTSQAWGHCLVKKSTFVDLTAFENLYVTYSGTYTTSTDSDYNKIDIQFYNESDVCIWEQRITDNGKSTFTNVTKSFDISTLQGRCRICFKVNANGSNMTLNVSSLYVD